MSSRGSSSKVKSSSPKASPSKATKTTPIKKINPYLKPILPFKKKALFVDTVKSQEKQSNLYVVCIRNSPIILFIKVDLPALVLPTILILSILLFIN